MKNKTNEGLWLREKNHIRLIPYKSISHIYHRDGISKICIGEKMVKEVHLPLNCLEQSLPDVYFFRTHRNYVINRDHITRVNTDNSFVYLEHGQEVPISRRKRKAFTKFLHKPIS